MGKNEESNQAEVKERKWLLPTLKIGPLREFIPRGEGKDRRLGREESSSQGKE